jgi:hypothetical protein
VLFRYAEAQAVNIARRCAAAFALAILAGCATEPLDQVPLQWKPTADANFGGADFTAAANSKIQFGGFPDPLPQPQVIGENHTEATPRTVTTRDKVGVFVSQRLRAIFEQAGLHTVDDGGDPVVSGEVQQFHVDEGRTYDAGVALRVTVRNRAGEVLWTGHTSGSAKRYGRSYVLDNYYEVLSDALQNAATTLLQDGDFRRALAGQR